MPADWSEIETDDDRARARRELADALDYARVTVCIGRNPDDPETIRTYVGINPETGHVCLGQAAALLRRLADDLLDVHGPGSC